MYLSTELFLYLLPIKCEKDCKWFSGPIQSVTTFGRNQCSTGLMGESSIGKITEII